MFTPQSGDSGHFYARGDRVPLATVDQRRLLPSQAFCAQSGSSTKGPTLLALSVMLV